jgi:hypothetical protein
MSGAPLLLSRLNFLPAAYDWRPTGELDAGNADLSTW